LLVAQLASLLLSVFLVAVAIDHVGLGETVGWIAAMAVVTAVNYLLAAKWVFRTADQLR
jgi:putative flippase GtrA